MNQFFKSFKAIILFYLVLVFVTHINGQGVIFFDSTTVNYGAIAGESQTPTQTVLLDNIGSGTSTLNWSATPSHSWINVTLLLE